MGHRGFRTSFAVLLASVLIANAQEIKVQPAGGIAIANPEGTATLMMNGRMQIRHTYEELSGEPDVNNFSVARMLLGVKGSVYSWRYEAQAEFAKREAVTLTDAFVERSLMPGLDLRVGQFKAAYDRQQLESSGRQTHVERNIASREFGKGREVGVQIKGATLERELQVSAGIFNGEGAGRANAGSGNMFLGRVSWNPLGDFGLSQGDLKPSPSPRIFLDGAAYYSVDGHRDAFGEAVDEAAATAGAGLRYAGAYVTGEYFHRARRASAMDPATTSNGWYAQANYMLVPQRLEAAVRHARIDPDRDASGNLREETTGGINVFFDDKGHAIKATFDVSWLADESPLVTDHLRTRAQLQLSF